MPNEENNAVVRLRNLVEKRGDEWPAAFTEEGGRRTARRRTHDFQDSERTRESSMDIDGGPQHLRWYDRNAVLILLLVFFFPAGAYALYKNNYWSPEKKLIAGVLATLFFIFSVVHD